MANFYALYPPTGVAGTVTIPSVGPNGTPIPGFSELVAGENPTGNLQPLQTNAAGSLIVTPDPASTGNVNLVQVGGAAITEGQKTSANSVPVVIASDQSTIPISAATLPLPTGAATSALQTTGNTSLSSILANQTNGTQQTNVVGSLPAGANAIGSVSVSNFPATQPVSGTVAATQSGTWTVQPGNTANTTPWLTTINQGGNSASVTGANALKVDGSAVTQPVSGTVTANAGTGTFTTSEIAAASSAVTSVASSASSVSLLASNASRKQATFYNDSTQILYLKLGTTASLTSYTVQIPSNGYYELPNGKIYSGAIDGIWAAANGNARITELS